ncbi:hypothetical protein WOLCODRAFT_78000 [Wolfiporia cocos MD-104 SS10]|uniref:Uncharacterized protein n=1 Tax=Wolfiporia cocos (strain MD-104) TaxID=742152 RepID=A0A2H3K1I0_WOLCO|nr:hypothetical protein WOLCODRAFT_78000 [Wolfiporia cocos MD-104 SS10]
MESSRRLLRYIREMHILGPRPVHPDFASMGQWMNDELATCLSHLNPAPALEEILISHGRSIVWGSDIPILRRVKKLTLWKCEFGSPPDFTDFLSNYFPNLTTLIIKDLRFLDTFGDPEKPGPRPHLHTLEINSSATQEFLLHWFLYQPPEDIRLENLSYTIAQWQVYAAPASLKALGSSVKHLTVNFAFPSPHQLLKGDPFLATFTTLQTLVFDCSTLYGTLYGPPSVPVLLQCVKAKDIASLQFRFALGDGASCDLEDTAQQISRIRLSETSKLLHTLRPFKHLSSVLVHVRLNEWSKCMRIRATEWVERQLEQHRGPLTLPDGTRMSNLEVWALRGFDATRAAEYERQFMQTSYRSYDQARQTWRKASNALEQALPLAHAAGILHIEPVECEKEPHLNRRC